MFSFVEFSFKTMKIKIVLLICLEITLILPRFILGQRASLVLGFQLSQPFASSSTSSSLLRYAYEASYGEAVLLLVGKTMSYCSDTSI